MSHEVFISYSPKDKSIADVICNTLENNQIQCWYAPRDIIAGKIYSDAICAAIEKSKVFILILSKNSNNSKWIKNEILLATKNNIKIIPLLVDNAKLPNDLEFILGTYSRIIVSTDKLHFHIEKLTETVKNIIKNHSYKPSILKSGETWL